MGVEEEEVKQRVCKPKMTLEAFQALMAHFSGTVELQGINEPKTVEDWIASLLTWLDYPLATIRSSKKPDITTNLQNYFPELFEPDFEPEKYFDHICENFAEQTERDVPDVKRGLLKLVE